MFEVSDTGSLKTLNVSIGENNRAVAVTSTKISNIRFRIKDFLIETFKAVVNGKSVKDDWMALSIVIFDYVQKVSGMRAYTLSQREAQVLFEMCRMIADQQKVSIDRLFQSAPDTLSQKDFLEALKVLETVHCIHYDLDQILLTNNTIRPFR